MAKSREAYVDTSALIAFLDRSDTYHSPFERLFSRPPRLVTTPLIVAEGHGWFLRRYDATREVRFLSLIEELEPMNALEIGPKDIAGSVAALGKFSDLKLTMADALARHAMQTWRTTICRSTDSHLGLTGIPLAIHATS